MSGNQRPSNERPNGMHAGKRPALADSILFVVIQKAYSRRDENALAAESIVSITDGMTKTGRERQTARARGAPLTRQKRSGR